MDKLFFRQGTLSQLNRAAVTPGAIDFTTDEPALYLNLNENGVAVRKRIGDVHEFDTLEKFKKFITDHTNDNDEIEIPTSGLYFIIETNSLLKFVNDGTAEPWIQINAPVDLTGYLTNETLADSENFKALNTNVQNLQTQVSALEESVNGGEDEPSLDERLQVVEDLIGATGGESDTGSIASRLNNLETKLDDATGLPKQITELDTAVSENTGNIEDLQSKVSALEESVNGGENESSLDERLQAVEELIGATDGESNADSITNRLSSLEDKLNDENGLPKQIAELDGAIDTNTKDIEDLQAAIQNKADASAVADLNTAVSSKASQESLDELAETVRGLAGLAGDVNTNTGAIGTLKTNVQDLQTANTTLTEAVNKKADKTYVDEIKKTADAAATKTALEGVDTRLTSIENNSIPQINTNKTNIESIQAELAQIPGAIDQKIKAANAMNYIGVITLVDGVPNLPTGNIHAGDTWVAGADFYVTEADYAYAGDLIIASGPETDGIIASNAVVWQVVKTGYQGAHDQTLAARDNKIQLSSFNGDNTTEVNFVSSNNNIKLTTDSATNTITMSLEWDSFE